MSESNMRSRLIGYLREFDAVAVENPAKPGTPDVNFIEGWIECKWLRRWPKVSDDSIIRCEHFTQQQRVWLKKRSLRGGNVFLLFQVGTEWMLIEGLIASEKFGKVSRNELYKISQKHWKILNVEELKDELRKTKIK